MYIYVWTYYGTDCDSSVQLHNHTSLAFPTGIRPLPIISLATPASLRLNSVQEQLLLSSLLPVISLFNLQTTQALLTTKTHISVENQ
jgi:hypothetical protein